MRFGVLTGGGDCPGLNAVIRAVLPAAMIDRYQMGQVVHVTSSAKSLIVADPPTLRLNTPVDAVFT